MGKGFGSHPTPGIFIHVDMRYPERAGALRNQRWDTPLWRKLHLVLPNLQALRVIPAPKTVNSLLAVMTTHGGGNEVWPLQCLPLH